MIIIEEYIYGQQKKVVFLSLRRSKIIQAYCPRYPMEGEQ